MSLNKMKTMNYKNPKNILNNINDYYIKIDYFDDKGTKKYIDKVPLKFIFDYKSNFHHDNNYI